MKRKICLLMSLALIVALSLTSCGQGSDYKKAMTLYENGKYEEAAVKFTELGDYESSKEMVKACKYEAAKAVFDSGDYESAQKAFAELGDYENSAEYVTECDYNIMHQKYSAVLDALNGNTWFFNGGSDTILNGISFTEDEATIAQVYFDGNGKHDNGSNTYSYVVDDKDIAITMADGSEMKIAYSLSGSSISLGNNEYYSLEEVDAGIQGYWSIRTSSTAFGMKMATEKNIYFNNGKVVMESASLANGSTSGEYYYYGPYEGSYTLNFGGLDTDMYHGSDWFFNIVDGKVVVINFDHICEPTDKLPGENGYEF